MLPKKIRGMINQIFDKRNLKEIIGDVLVMEHINKLNKYTKMDNTIGCLSVLFVITFFWVWKKIKSKSNPNKMGSVGINKPTPSVYSSILTEKGVKKAMETNNSFVWKILAYKTSRAIGMRIKKRLWLVLIKYIKRQIKNRDEKKIGKFDRNVFTL